MACFNSVVLKSAATSFNARFMTHIPRVPADALLATFTRDKPSSQLLHRFANAIRTSGAIGTHNIVKDGKRRRAGEIDWSGCHGESKHFSQRCLPERRSIFISLPSVSCVLMAKVTLKSLSQWKWAGVYSNCSVFSWSKVQAAVLKAHVILQQLILWISNSTCWEIQWANWADPSWILSHNLASVKPVCCHNFPLN